MSEHFKPGALAVVQPRDSDDPEALAHAGRRCRVVRSHRTPFGSMHIGVQFSTQGRTVYLRAQDLVDEEQGAE